MTSHALSTSGAAPIKTSERFAILDILRGFALLGIAIANFSEFSLYSFLDGGARESMSTAAADTAVYYLEYIFVDGKFYTLFSLLFGVGFSIILRNADRRGVSGMRVFYRRMAALLLFGLLHLLFLWSGDILMLYAAVGMLLPLLRNLCDRALVAVAALLLVLPVGIDFLRGLLGYDPAAPFVRLQWHYCAAYGITEENFAFWLRDAKSYGEMLQFLAQGAFERMQEFVVGNRYFKVLGLFIFGYVVGRSRLYARLGECVEWLGRIAVGGLAVGLPVAVAYAYSSMNGKPWGGGVHALLYLFNVYPMGFAYLALLCLVFFRHPQCRPLNWLAAAGRMALSNYIGQSILGVLIFYGVGLGLGASLGLVCVVPIAVAVFVFEVLFSRWWLSHFQFGLLEWTWRLLTYGKVFKLSLDAK